LPLCTTCSPSASSSARWQSIPSGYFSLSSPPRRSVRQ